MTRTKFYLLLFLPLVASGAEYTVSRQPDGPIAGTIGGVEINKGSSLTRESIVLNDPDCPVTITRHETELFRTSGGFGIRGLTFTRFSADTYAIELRTRMFDVFGAEMTGVIPDELVTLEVRDHTTRSRPMAKGEFRVSSNQLARLLTTVTYVSQVLLKDGRVWEYNSSGLAESLSGLELRLQFDDDQDQ